MSVCMQIRQPKKVKGGSVQHQARAPSNSYLSCEGWRDEQAYEPAHEDGIVDLLDIHAYILREVAAQKVFEIGTVDDEINLVDIHTLQQSSHDHTDDGRLGVHCGVVGVGKSQR